MRGQLKLFYVLSPLSSGLLKDGHRSTTDELLLAVGDWRTELHEEIYVMDEGNWSKSHDLWKSVQGCSWVEVILESDMKGSLIEDVHGFFNNQQLCKKLSVPWKRGVILHGVPGNAKPSPSRHLSIPCRLVRILFPRYMSSPSMRAKGPNSLSGPSFRMLVSWPVPPHLRRSRQLSH